jgi:hypothetical protein
MTTYLTTSIQAENMFSEAQITEHKYLRYPHSLACTIQRSNEVARQTQGQSRLTYGISRMPRDKFPDRLETTSNRGESENSRDVKEVRQTETLLDFILAKQSQAHGAMQDMRKLLQDRTAYHLPGVSECFYSISQTLKH